MIELLPWKHNVLKRSRYKRDLQLSETHQQLWYLKTIKDVCINTVRNQDKHAAELRIIFEKKQIRARVRSWGSSATCPVVYTFIPILKAHAFVMITAFTERFPSTWKYHNNTWCNSKATASCFLSLFSDEAPLAPLSFIYKSLRTALSHYSRIPNNYFNAALLIKSFVSTKLNISCLITPKKMTAEGWDLLKIPKGQLGIKNKTYRKEQCYSWCLVAQGCNFDSRG